MWAQLLWVKDFYTSWVINCSLSGLAEQPQSTQHTSRGSSVWLGFETMKLTWRFRLFHHLQRVAVGGGGQDRIKKLGPRASWIDNHWLCHQARDAEFCPSPQASMVPGLLGNEGAISAPHPELRIISLNLERKRAPTKADDFTGYWGFWSYG